MEASTVRGVYGRGTLDMKGGRRVFLAMAKLARRRRAGADIVFLAESGEETFDPSIGVGWVLAHRPDLLEGVHEVFNEGGVNAGRRATWSVTESKFCKVLRRAVRGCSREGAARTFRAF